MTGSEELLHRALERLETGQALEAAGQNLPDEERLALSLASDLRQAGWPALDPQIAQTQRIRLAKFYQQEANMETHRNSRTRSFFDWRWLAGLAAGVVVLAICGLLASLGVGWLALQNDSRAGVPTAPALSAGTGETSEPAQAGEAPVVPTQTRPVQAVQQQPGEALLANLHGFVELQQGEVWVPVKAGDRLTQGARLRTGALSSVTLVYLDKSQTQLGQYSEISIDTLHTTPDGSSRDIALTLWAGESDHQVTPLASGQGRYEVQTSTSRGLAQGTRFRTRIVSKRSIWVVEEGALEVTGKESTVRVAAGMMTTVNPEKDPRPPMEFFSGQGELSYIGENWVINGETFLASTRLVVIGDPQVGDIVFYEGHRQVDGTPVVDLVVLLRRNPANTFTLTGEVQAIGEKEWTVNGQTVAITGTTMIQAGIVVGDLVRVDGLILDDGSLQAQEIHPIEDRPGTPFDFTGVVQIYGEGRWVVSGVTLTVDASTIIDEGIITGELVRVRGWILEDGTWLASSIARVQDESSSFELTGAIESIDPWRVAGLSFETREWTEIDEGLQVGELVHVEGMIQPDGTWVAYEIRRVGEAQVTILIGRVFSTNPWIVSGFHLNVDEETIILEDIRVGALVRVELVFLPDGTHKVLRITPVSEFWWWLGPGCHTIVVTYLGMDGDFLHLEDWPDLELGEGLQIPGDLRPGAILLIQICYDEDGHITIITIIIIYQPEPLPPPDDTTGRVTICHKPNGKHPQTKTLPSSALGGHLGHGDTLGPCGGDHHDYDDHD